MRHERPISLEALQRLPETTLDISVPFTEQRSDRCFRVDQIKPWMLEIWEPLNTKAPNPTLARPHCCYINVVIFYVKPYTVRPWHHLWRTERPTPRSYKEWLSPCFYWHGETPGHHYEEWDRAEHHLMWDTRFTYCGAEFETGGGTVFWIGKRWWMKHWARRKQANGK